MKKLLIFVLLEIIVLTNLVNAIDLKSFEHHYASEYNIATITSTNQPKNDKDWIGIYAVADNTDWANVIDWSWAEDESDSLYDFLNLPDGNYEARFFFNNTYKVEASVPFIIGDVVSIDIQKEIYQPNEEIVVKVAKISGDRDWVGIYPKGSNNSWNNVVKWEWAKNNGNVNIEGVEAGEYEARLFFNNSYKVESKVRFKVSDVIQPTLSTSKNNYTENEIVTVNVSNLSGNQDWVGIYPKNANNSWENVIAWNWMTDNGSFNLSTIRKDMPIGEYEIRLFFNNSYQDEKTFAFTVDTKQLPKKKLILHAHSGGWFPMMARNLVPRHEYIKTLPFSGYGVVGNTYTNEVMKRNITVTYDNIWNELKGLKGLYSDKSNFLVVDMHFPGDLWDNEAWNKVTNNFKTLAKVSKDLGFAGIIYDDEAYTNDGKKLLNYDKNGYFDEYAYKTPNKDFSQHVVKITARFQTIMEGMVSVFPTMDLLYYHSPVEGHIAADYARKDGQALITGVGREREHELIGAMFLGLKRGLSEQASIHDMGEDYTLTSKEHFTHAYTWRKHTIASNAINDAVNTTEHWAVPKEDRESWAKDVNLGFMVSNFPRADANPEFDTRDKVGLNYMKNTLENSLDRSDEYVIFYSASSTDNGVGNIKLDWLQDSNTIANDGSAFGVNPQWMDMMNSVYDKIK